MKLTAKIGLWLIPAVVTGVAVLGYTSYLTAYQTIKQREFETLAVFASQMAYEIADSREQVLVSSGLKGIASFEKAYQNEVLEELEALSLSTGKQFAVYHKSELPLIQKNIDEMDTLNRAGNGVLVGILDDSTLFANIDYLPWEWTIVVSEDISSLRAELWRITWLTFLASLLSACVVYLCVKLVIKNIILNRLHLLEKATSQIAESKQTVKINIENKDEIGRLAKSIETMSTTIETSLVKAQAANKAKSEFLSVMSHEIRTPLNGVIGIASILEKTELDDHQRELTRNLIKSADSLTTLVSDVLDLAKIEAGSVEVDESEFEVNDLLSGVKTLYEASANAKNTIIEINCATNLVVRSDRAKLRQILNNLVNNAVKFTEGGSITLSAQANKAPQDEPQGTELTFTVTDTGIGIDKTAQTKIFDRFTQADYSITRKHGGSGLGLAIVKNLVDLLNGSINLDSELNKGTEFTLSVPVTLMTERQVINEPYTEQKCTPERHLTVLLAEDNDINALVATTMLEDFGHNVTRVINGREALEVAEQQSFEMIFMDIHMPEMDGIRSTQAIRQLDKYTNTPIIGLTAEAFKERHALFLSEGMDFVLTKPLSEHALLSAISDYHPDRFRHS